MGDGWLARGDCIKEARERKISGNVCRRVVARSCAGISLVRESSALMRLIIAELTGLSLSLSLSRFHAEGTRGAIGLLKKEKKEES